ncbi:hypothetical protein FRB96_006311 [Tulasnella sp. 330]|nr:hypothetical protein FRB96_006311 [Tulasnella sp. 330]KAG8885079.1 hypothetical protein FRB97_002244 [Tulasnella sp. 331]KAG8890632.1 hypothetical protein FRB98_007187 [Tulasnella sp. 332]
MGYTALGRWRDADAAGFLGLNRQIKEKGGTPIKAWNLSARFYRSSSWPTRSINSVTLGDCCYVLMEDTAAPSYKPIEAGSTRPPHWRNTYMTFSPPTVLGPLLQQLGGSWTNRLPGTQPDIEIAGTAYALGSDYIIRVGRVMQRGEQRGVVIEAEVLPMVTSGTGTPLGLSELLSDVTPVRTEEAPPLDLKLTGLSQINADVKGVSLNDDQWEDVLRDTEDVDDRDPQAETSEDQIFTYRGEEGKPRHRDWTGADRDKRSAFLILRLLMTENTQQR